MAQFSEIKGYILRGECRRALSTSMCNRPILL